MLRYYLPRAPQAAHLNGAEERASIGANHLPIGRECEALGRLVVAGQIFIGVHIGSEELGVGNKLFVLVVELPMLLRFEYAEVGHFNELTLSLARLFLDDLRGFTAAYPLLFVPVVILPMVIGVIEY